MGSGQAIGLFGGTFDPIHFGHIQPVIEAAGKLGLTKILLIPNKQPVHKSQACASAQQRLDMLNLVCNTYPLFTLDTREVERQEKSYSLLTLQELSEQYPKARFYFFIGMDSLNTLPTWFGGEKLFDYCHFVVTRRPGHPLESNIASVFAERIIENPTTAPSKHAGNILIFDTNQLDISSSQIRRAISENSPIEHLLPDDVFSYISKQKLYQEPVS